jgi:hypothetical protein
MALKWLDSTLITGNWFALCLTEKAFISEMKKMKVFDSPRWINDSAQATTHLFTSDSGSRCAIVCIDPTQLEQRTGVQVASILVHEAVHVWQDFAEFIGERNPSIEFEAYSIQNISEQLMSSYKQHIFKE